MCKESISCHKPSQNNCCTLHVYIDEIEVDHLMHDHYNYLKGSGTREINMHVVQSLACMHQLDVLSSPE